MSELSKINIDGTVYDVKDVVARKKLISVTGATSGQTIKISEVNADGIPVSWEAVDPFVLTDEITGKKYKLSVMNGKLTMDIVNEV